MLLIQNGYIADPKSGTEGVKDILIRGERIEAVGTDLFTAIKEGRFMECECADTTLQIIDASGLTVLPGLIDVHTHFRDPGFTYKEDIITGAAAAAKGGFTTVVLMANTKPVVDNIDTLTYVLDKGKQTPIRVESCAAVSYGLKGEEITDMEKLHSIGAAGFTDDGIPLMDEELVRQAMLRTRKLNVPISFHEENPKLITNNGVNAGIASAHYGIGGSPREAEISLVERDLKIAVETDAIMDVQHISAKETVELIREAKKKSANIHAEACPHHFTLTEEAVIQYGTLAKMNPPLRTEEDRQAIIAGLLDGTIDMIATDHAPHSKEEKDKPITEAPSGIIGLETAFSLAYEELVDKHGMSLATLADRMSYAPAKMYGFVKRGYIEEGALADLVLIDTNETWIAGDYESKSSNSPFTGKELKAVIVKTICDGKIAYEK